MHEPIRVVVVNSTPIIALALLGRLELLRLLYGVVIIPPAVRAEVLTGGMYGIGVADLQQADWIQVRPLQDPQRATLLSDLDQGEAQVIALAQELNADLVIIDERLARRHAKRVGLKLTGVLGVLVRAKAQGHVAVVKPLIVQLQRDGIWLGTEVVAEALRLAGES